MVTSSRTPYDGIDPPVRNLIRVLNRFPGTTTYTSCGGHDDPQFDAQAPAGCWYVDSHIDRSDEGYASLEFFAWVNYDLRSRPIYFEPLAKPPFLNFPGHMLWYRWSGNDPGRSQLRGRCLRRALDGLPPARVLRHRPPSSELAGGMNTGRTKARSAGPHAMGWRPNDLQRAGSLALRKSQKVRARKWQSSPAPRNSGPSS
jgi:hypothetical protein